MTAILTPPLKWAGGKAGNSMSSWICGQLPHARGYVEPFSGMLAVLLARRRSAVEMVNDVDGNVVAFWRAIRDDCDELCRRVAATPASRDEFKVAHAAMTDPDTETMERAWALAVCLGQCFIPNLSSLTWRPNWTDNSESWGRVPQRMRAVAGRLAGVVIENRDAVELLAYEVCKPDVVIYCDPPYGADSAATSARTYWGAVDRGAMLDVLRGAVAQVAVGGYPGDTWEALEGDGWRRTEKRLYSPMATKNTGHDPRRTEVLWMNYPAVQPTLL